MNPHKDQPLVLVEEVGKTYDSRGEKLVALDRVSLRVRDGEFISIVGPSGCGKSTLLLAIAGLVPLSRGSIIIDGSRVTGPRADLGFVFQDPVLLDWRSVLRNIMIQAEVRKLKKHEVRLRALELLNLVGLRGFEDRLPHELSGGMRQRVSICRALVHDPRVLLMDEPFGALDALTRDQLNVDLQALWLESRKTVIFVTHSISEAVFLADRVAVFTPRPGRIQTIIDVELPRPRPLNVRETPDFGRYTQTIRALFTALGVLREDFAEEPIERRVSA